MSDKITWCSKVGFGTHADLSLITLKIKEPGYLKWCYEKEIHTVKPVIAFIFDNLSKKEIEEILNV